MSPLVVEIPFAYLQSLAEPIIQQQLTEWLKTLPSPDEWLTIPQAAAYISLTERHMRLLVLGRPYRPATADEPPQPAIAPSIPCGDTGFARGTRVRRSAVDAYLMRHKHQQ
jgi:hypothetical protein